MQPSKLVFTGILIKDSELDPSISALCLELDVASEGETAKEAKANLIEAVTLYIETAVENNLPILRPIPKEENPLIKDSSKVIEKFNLKIDFSVHAYA